MQTLLVRLAESKPDRAAALALRLEVFVEEQGVPEALERDALDDVCTHFLALDGVAPVGCARLFPLDDQTIKAGRVAVKSERRGEGIGKEIMVFAEDWARDAGYARMLLHAQEPVVGFYLRLGYEISGERFFEAEIPHFKMERSL